MNKKLVALVFVTFSTSVFAFGHGSYCIAHPDVVAKKIADKGGRMTINYSSDELDHANQCKSALLSQDKSLQIALVKVSGTGQFAFAK